jgi:hypothetical protein
LADQAALGTVAAATTGNPDAPSGTFDGSLGQVFDEAITGPWCYLEFGDVEWCRDSSQLDPALMSTARKLQRLYAAGAACSGGAPGLVVCPPGGSAEQRSYSETAAALGAARTNGALFLALPAGGPGRNGLSSQTSLPSLFATLCGSNDVAACTAGTAPQAEFRTAADTWPRAGGLLLITIGTAGMLATLTFIAMRLFGAALGLLVYLMLAPLAILAPTFGYAGRATFRRWILRLLGAVVAKLVYSLMLGVLLLISGLLAGITTFGWWTQWLLVSTFWWLAFEHRHSLLSTVLHERSEPSSRLPLATRVRYGARTLVSGGRSAQSLGHTTGRVIGGVAEAVTRGRVSPREDSRAQGRVAESAGARGELSRQVDRTFLAERAGSLDRAGDERAALIARRSRLASAAAEFHARGNTRRAFSLASRLEAVDAELGRPSATREMTSMGRLREHRARRRLFDREAMRPRGEGRDYAALAGLAGLTRQGYGNLDTGNQFAARAAIERELSRRRELLLKAQLGRPWHRLGVDSGHPRPTARVVGSRERQFAARMRG